MSALLIVTGIANWHGVTRAQQLEQYQVLDEARSSVSMIAEAVARERAASVRARASGAAVATQVVDRQQVVVDRMIDEVSRAAPGARGGEDVGGRLDAVGRRLFALRSRTASMSIAEIQTGYAQAIDSLSAIERDLTVEPPTRDVATAVFADVAMRSAVEDGRREQLGLWALLRSSERSLDRPPYSSQFEALEQSSLNAYRSTAPSADIADLNAALFSPAGLYVRKIRAQLAAGRLEMGPFQAERWWQESGSRLIALGQIREGSREAVSSTIAADLGAARTTNLRTLTFSAAVLLLVLALGLLLRRSIARSLQELSRGARALSGGDLGVEIATTGNDEIAEVGQAFGAVRATNRKLVDELQTMNAAIAGKDLDHRADPTAFDGAWADVLEGMNGTMTEVARLHGAAEREVERQKAFGLLGRRVVSGLAIDLAYRECCALLVDHVCAVRAEVYDLTPDGWERRTLVGVDAVPWPPEHAFTTGTALPSRRVDAALSVVRTIGEAEHDPVVALAVEFADEPGLDAADVLFIDGAARLLDEASRRRRDEDARLRAQKLDATGTMAAAIAHDFNNVLGAILNNARLGELETKDEEAAETFTSIAGAVSRASEIVDRLLSFARSEPPSRDAFELPTLIDEACSLLRPGLPAGVELTCTVEGTVPTIMGDPTRIHQVVVNLITNSAQALGAGPGQITVTVDETAFSGKQGERFDGTAVGRYARVRVHDTGPGIPDAVARHVFDPFFTTKPKGQGTGLGLAAALTIARDHHGTLDIGSTPGGGTTATLCLPIATEPLG